MEHVHSTGVTNQRKAQNVSHEKAMSGIVGRRAIMASSLDSYTEKALMGLGLEVQVWSQFAFRSGDRLGTVS